MQLIFLYRVYLLGVKVALGSAAFFMRIQRIMIDEQRIGAPKGILFIGYFPHVVSKRNGQQSLTTGRPAFKFDYRKFVAWRHSPHSNIREMKYEKDAQ
jgi:hypothetical protein